MVLQITVESVHAFPCTKKNCDLRVHMFRAAVHVIFNTHVYIFITVI